MTNVFVIVSESGNRQDYTTRNICAYQDQKIANQICDTLNAIVIAQRKFEEGPLQKFKTEYRVAHPLPHMEESPRFLEICPQLTPELQKLNEKDRKGEVYETYLNDVRAYNIKLGLFKTRCFEAASAIQNACIEWNNSYRNAVNEKRLEFDFANLIPEGLQEIIKSCLVHLDADSFLVEEIELYGSVARKLRLLSSKMNCVI